VAGLFLCSLGRPRPGIPDIIRTKGRNIMSTKLKALSLGLLVFLATAGFEAVNASAAVSGHFTHDATTNHATILGTANGSPHDLVFREEGSEAAGTTCTHADLHGQAPAKAVTSVTVTPAFTGCATTSSSTWGETVHTNGCAFILSSSSTTHGTVTIECPTNQAIEITHPNCTLKVPAQHPSPTRLTGGIVYDTTVEGGKHTLTPTVTVKKITVHFEGGICVFLGTSHNFEMNGALTVAGFDTAGERVNITHT